MLVFPIWWHDTPAILKGFLDKVMLHQFSYQDTKTGIKGLLINIEDVTIITTSKSPTWYLKYFGGNAIEKY
ncbi:MAG: NAD(P)H-dependent oxidoreductase [Pseudolactococcus laudensis]